MLISNASLPASDPQSLAVGGPPPPSRALQARGAPRAHRPHGGHPAPRRRAAARARRPGGGGGPGRPGRCRCVGERAPARAAAGGEQRRKERCHGAPKPLELAPLDGALSRDRSEESLGSGRRSGGGAAGKACPEAGAPSFRATLPPDFAPLFGRPPIDLQQAWPRADPPRFPTRTGPKTGARRPRTDSKSAGKAQI